MALDVTGKLVQKLAVQSGTSARGEWKKQEFILETQEQYPKKVCISLWGDKVNELDSAQIGDVITVSVNLESREFNGRWYTEARAWRIQRSAPNGGGQTGSTSAQGSDDYSFLSGSSEDAVDDLPF